MNTTSAISRTLFSRFTSHVIFLLLSVFSFPLLAAELYHNVNGYTFNQEETLIRFSNMLVDAGKVVEVSQQDLSTKYPKANKIDGNGKTLIPGLIDAHGHLLRLGESLLEIDVREGGSEATTAKMVAQYYQKNPSLSWVTGRGWNQVLWPSNAFPTRKSLDQVLKDVPVWLERVDGHAGWANSATMKRAGISKDTPSPEGGKILKNKNGEPTGVFIDTAMALIEKHLPKTDQNAQSRQLEAVGKHLLALGITSMHDAGIDKMTYDFYLSKAKDKQLPLRVYAMLSAADPSLNSMVDKGIVKSGDDMLLIRSVKAYGDGALGSRGAALIEPYADDPGNHGLLVTPEAALPNLFDTVISKGFALHFHAIGDRANQLALDHFEKTFEKRGGKTLRHRIEHAQVIRLEDIPRFKSLNIIPSMQPTHATSDKNMAEDRVGAERIKGAYAWRTFLKQGSRLAFGSDFPVELANPFYGLHAAVTRQDRDNQPVKGWYPEQALSIDEAFKAFTLDAAFAGNQENVIGRLQPGQWADFIFIDRDIFDIDPKDIWKTDVIATYLAGEKVYSR